MSKFLACKWTVLQRMLFLHWAFNFLCVNGVSVTFTDRFLSGHVFSTSYGQDWLQCILFCRSNSECVSYNFDKSSGTCELNNHGLSTEIDAELALTRASEFIFHQIRPSGSKRVPRKFASTDNQCECRCPQSACTPNPNVGNRYLPVSCKDLQSKRRTALNDGAYDIQIPPRADKVRVYCHMKEDSACGGGGWTLVMKINGSKSTFLYESSYWLNKDTYQPEEGESLSRKETKLQTYWALPFTEICLGMAVEREVRWLKVPFKAKSLYDVISPGAGARTNITLDSWRSLINSSSIQTSCTKQGFNTRVTENDTHAKARIGIIGFSDVKCTSSQSRIGFGTSGTFYGMKKSACGNEAQNKPDNGVKSIPAFGYIMVK